MCRSSRPQIIEAKGRQLSLHIALVLFYDVTRDGLCSVTNDEQIKGEIREGRFAARSCIPSARESSPTLREDSFLCFGRPAPTRTDPHPNLALVADWRKVRRECFDNCHIATAEMMFLYVDDW